MFSLKSVDKVVDDFVVELLMGVETLKFFFGDWDPEFGE